MCLTKKQNNLFLWIRDFKNAIQKKRAESLENKLNTLWFRAYEHYLMIYLGDVEENKRVDFPPFEYLSGRIVCQFAFNKANEEIQEIKRGGPGRINQCYTTFLSNAQRAAKKYKNKEV